jgi:hypothetical protein
MTTAKMTRGSLVAIATAATIAAGFFAVGSSADAHSYRHHYGRAFGGAYGYGGPYRVHMYAADHYYRRPLVGGSRVNNNLNPDFQLGGGYAGQQ